MDFSVLKTPIVIATLAGSLLVTNVITYNVTASNECGRVAEEQAAWDKLLGRDKTLNPNREGGLRMDGEFR
jgi:hypothetical protein